MRAYPAGIEGASVEISTVVESRQEKHCMCGKRIVRACEYSTTGTHSMVVNSFVSTPTSIQSRERAGFVCATACGTLS